jgi:glycerol-3-phosphate dehydrogenase (NAD(P)+)
MASEWVNQPELVILAVPSRFVEEVLRKFTPPGVPVVSSVKGMEPERYRMVHEVISEVWGEERFVVLAGPNFAEEISAGKPAAAVAASADEGLARKVQCVFNQPGYRVYVSLDPIGVQLGGALKNVYALAAGACVALGYGQNAEAGLVTRALAEMSRVGVALGGRLETFTGLSGVGDLILTCYSDMSRNRRFGKFLALGKSFRETLSQLGGVAEGVTTVRALRERCRRLGVPAPIVESIYSAIYERRPLELVIKELLESVPDLESREEMGMR